MALSLAQKFINLGMAAPLAVEYARQIEQESYNWKRLMWLGMVPTLAKYVAESLALGNFKATSAMEKTMAGEIAKLTAVGSAFPIPALPNWSAAVSAAKAGTRDARVMYIGDSTTWGQGALSAAYGANDKSASHPTVLARDYTYRGLPGSWQNFTGTGNIGGSPYPTYDNRFVIGPSGAQSPSTTESMGGRGFRGSVVGDIVTFTPVGTEDMFDIYYLREGSGGVMGLSVNAGVATQVNTNGASALLVTTVSGVAGQVNTLTISLVSGTRATVFAIVGRKSTQKQILMMNAGVPGFKVADYASSATVQAPLNAFDEFDLDLTVIDLGINDWNSPSPTSEVSYKASMQSLIDAAKASGSDVLLVVPVPSGTADGIANQGLFQNYIKDLGVSNNCPVVDMIAAWSSWAAQNALGRYRDTLHPNSLGYAAKASIIAQSIGAR